MTNQPLGGSMFKPDKHDLMMWTLFIIGLLLIGSTPWGFLPLIIAVGYGMGC
jgi:hypothetical protein